MIRQTSLRPTLKSYRLALVVIACVSVAALLVSRGSKAASPASGTLTTANTPTNPLTFTGGPYAIGNPSNFVNLVCSPPVAPCDDYALTVDLPDGLQDTKQVRVVVSWADTNADIDLAIYQRNADGTVGAEVTRAGTSSDPEIALLPAVKGSYVVRVIPFAPLNQTVTTAITVEPKASRFTQGAGTAPGYRNYAAPGGLGTDSGEPSLGVNWNTGNVMFIAKLQTLRVTFDNIGGAAWKDVSGLTTSLATTDAILWTDSTTGRTIASQLTGTNSLSAFTDNDGDSWTPTEGGPLTSGVDHQTVGGGPYAPPLRGGTALYPHAVYYCSQDLVTAFCARSDDGGLTFGPTIPMFLQTCGGIHGHVKVAPDGTVYVPNRSCGSNQGVLVSEDNGITWDVRTVADADPTTSTYDSITDHWDPSVGVGSNGALYFGYDNGDGTAHIAVSHDRGRSWATDQNVGLPYGIKDTAFPAVVAGDDDRAAFAFLGSQAPSGSDAAVWHLYIATTYDSGNSWTTVDATPTDPVQRGTICFDGFGVGACPKGDRNLLDFMDATVDKLGRVLVGYADGCVGCSSAGGSRAKLATIARQTCGRRLFSQYDSTAEDCGAATPTPTPTATPTPTPTPTPGNDPRCNPPGVKLFDDPADDQFGGPNANQQADIRAVSMAEQYTSGGQVLVFTMKLSQINPLVQPPNTFWQINFNATHADGTTTTYFVNAATNTNSNPAGIAYRYGFLDAAASTGATQLSVGAADSGAIDGNAGTITITLNTNKLKKPVPPASGQTNSTLTGPQVDLSAGKQLVAIVAETSQLIGAAGTGAGLTLDDTASAEYTMAGAAACPAATPTPTPGGGNTGAVVLHFHGNTDDGTCTGQGTADVQACGGPFLKTSATLATTPAAHWDTGPNLLDGTSAHNIYDPNWLWNSGAVRLGGDMTVEWWASCSACGAGVGNADWIIRLFADNQKVFEKTVRATPTTPNVPQLLSAKLFLPETNVGTSVVLQIETTFVDSQSMTHFFYDSQSACPGVVGGPACDSRVTMPVLAPGQVAPTPTPTPTPTPGITPTPTPANPALAPRYTNYTTPSGVAESAGEPSVGVNWKSERSFSNSAGSVANGGTVTYFGGFLPYMLRATFDDSVSPASVMWDQAPLTIANAPRVFGDPILFTDHQTGRTFVSQEFGLTPLGSTMEWTDDDGRSFKPSMGSGAPSGVDHQTVGGGPYHTPLNITTNPVYPNSVYYCSQALEYAVCALSVDGGTTFGPSVPMYTFRDCGGIHGHVKVAPDGTVYVPNRSCNGEQGVALSEDNGITWKVRHVTGSSPGDTDPSIGIASDGTLYFGYETTDFHARIAVSHDKGQTWINDADAGAQLGINSIVFPEVVAGDPDRAAFAYLGSTTAGNYNDDAYTGVFYLIIASTFDGGKTWTTINATPNDPVQRGRVCTDGINCTGTSRNLLDFFDFSVDKEGRGVVGYVDGCTGSCVQSGPNTGSAKAVVARQSGGKRLFAQFDPPAASAPGAPAVAGSLSGTTVSLSWSTPDNGGAAITNYKVYRRDGTTVTPLATVTNNSFSDPGYNATTQTVYRVTALNANGESAYKEFNPAGGGTGGQSACAQPGVLVVSDVNSDGADLDGNQNTPPDARVNIKGLYVAEPYMGAGINKLVFTLKVAPSTLGAAPPSSQWYIIWNRPVPDANFDRWYVAMKTDATGTPTFEYGKFGVATNTSTSQIPPPQSTSTNQSVKIGDADGGSYDPVTGTITITLSTSKAENVTAGRTLGGMNARTFFARPDAGLRAQSVASDITGDGSYKMVGNGSCSSASLVAPQNNNTSSSGAQVAWVSAPYALTRWATGLIF